MAHHPTITKNHLNRKGAGCGHKGIHYSTGFSHSGSNVITSGHSANVRRLGADNARMDADSYRYYHKSSDKQWNGHDGLGLILAMSSGINSTWPVSYNKVINY